MSNTEQKLVDDLLHPAPLTPEQIENWRIAMVGMFGATRC